MNIGRPFREMLGLGKSPEFDLPPTLFGSEYIVSLKIQILISNSVQGQEKMSDHVVPHFQNNAGVNRIEIGVKEFKCVGANPPNDHPHIFLDMGDDNEKVCSYCSTHYVFNKTLSAEETVPQGCTLEIESA